MGTFWVAKSSTKIPVKTRLEMSKAESSEFNTDECVHVYEEKTGEQWTGPLEQPHGWGV